MDVGIIGVHSSQQSAPLVGSTAGHLPDDETLGGGLHPPWSNASQAVKPERPGARCGIGGLPMWSRWTEKARRAIWAATDMATAQGQDDVAIEQLLFALLRDDNVASRLLRQV